MTPIETALLKVDDEIRAVREWSTLRLQTEAEQCADVLASSGVMFWWPDSELAKQTKRAGQPLRGGEGTEPDPGEVFAALPRALAILSLRPQGVEFDTAHFCDNRHQGLCERGEVSFPHDPDRAGIKSRGATFTPRYLAEMVTNDTLDAVVYRPGPLHTPNRDEWKLIPPAEFFTKTVGDISVGCGVFPLAAVRYLVATVLHHHPQLRLREMDLRILALRQVYGVDIHPGSIAITRLVMALMVPHIDIDPTIYRHFLVGDALLGITSLDQLRWMHMDPEKGRKIHRTQPVPDEWIAGRAS